MRKFTSLVEGLNYVTVCPICKSWTELNDRDVSIIPLKHIKETVHNADLKGKLGFDLDGEDILGIDIESGKVEIIRGQHTFINNSLLYEGATILNRIGIDCNNCCQYSYLLQIHIDMAKMMVVDVVLDSEVISLEIKDQVHEIKNSYITNSTIYNIIVRHREEVTKMTNDGLFDFIETVDRLDKTIILPLVPMDLLKPYETLDRITNLLVFS